MSSPIQRVTMLVLNPFTHDSRVEKEARSLQRAGYAVTVVAEGRPDLPEREVRDGYEVVRVRRATARLPGHRLVQFRARLEAALVGTAPDVLHAHDSDALWPVSRVARRRRLPYVYDAHELWLGQENRGRTPLYFALFRAWYRWIQRRAIPRAAAVLTVSEPIAQALARDYGVRVTLVPNYPDLDEATARRELADLLDEPLPAGAPVVLYLGNVQVGRGLEELLEALRQVPDAVVVILGAREEHAELASLAAQLGVRDRLRLVPRVAPEEVISYAATATCGIALTTPISENNRLSLSNKLFQYMAAGVPVVANDAPHIRVIVEGSGAGVCVDPTDPAAIAAALRRLLADPEAAAAMGARGADAVRTRYNWANSEQALLEVYGRIRDGAGGVEARTSAC